MHNIAHSVATWSPRRCRIAPQSLLFGALIAMVGVTSPALLAQQLSLDAQKPEMRALVDIYQLDSDGQLTPQSLSGIDWMPAEDARLLSTAAAAETEWFPLLPLTDDGEPVSGRTSIAMGSVTESGTRRAALGANLIHDLLRPHVSGGTANARSEAWLEHVVAWLIDEDMPFAPVGAPEIKVVLAHLAAPSGEDEDAITREWFQVRGDHITVSTAWACDGSQLTACLDGADLVVLGPGQYQPLAVSSSVDSHAESQAIVAALHRMDDQGIPVLYMHDGALDGSMANGILNELAVATKQNSRGWQVMQAGADQLRQNAPLLAAANP